MDRRRWLMMLVATLSLSGAALAEAERAPHRFAGLDGYGRAITTASKEAQAWFDQGIALYFGFNHAEAILSFEAAAAADPECAMAHFGIALAAGPHINNPAMDEAASKLAYESVQKAQSLLNDESAVERALIAALATRYAWPAPEDRQALDTAYAEAMQKVWASFPEDADVGAWAAESRMDLRPWDLWTPDGQPHPGTLDIVSQLEQVLALDPRHPGACHFYIHTMEASPTPEKAMAAANLLRDRLPAAGHLVHMPAHIDIRTGNYAGAVTSNQHAIRADLDYAELRGRAPGFYTIYRAHNYHFLAFAAMFEGRRDLALQAAHDLLEQIPIEAVLALADGLDAFMAVPIHVYVRFGLWDRVLAFEEPRAELLASRAFWRYGRTVALASLGRVEEATSEFAALQTAIAQVPESRTMGNNSVLTIMEIGRRMAEGELLYRKGEVQRAFELLREAVALDVALKYDEPWGWMQPVAHALGALLLEQGELAEAEAVYRADLVLHPGNGWALHGLSEALKRQGKQDESKTCSDQFQKAWSRADIKIKGSCYCRRGSGAG